MWINLYVGYMQKVFLIFALMIDIGGVEDERVGYSYSDDRYEKPRSWPFLKPRLCAHKGNNTMIRILVSQPRCLSCRTVFEIKPVTPSLKGQGPSNPPASVHKVPR